MTAFLTSTYNPSKENRLGAVGRVKGVISLVQGMSISQLAKLKNNLKASEDISREGPLALRRSLKLSNTIGMATVRELLDRHWHGAYMGMNDCPECQWQQVHRVKSER